jgi:hypothetical protein
MRLDELFKNLGYIAGTIGAQMREACEGLPLAELDLTGPPPREIGLRGPCQIVLNEGEALAIEVEAGPESGEDEVHFLRDGERLAVSGGDRTTVVRVTLPAPRKVSVAGSGRVTLARLGHDGEVSIAGSGRVEVAALEGGRVKASLAGSGRAAIDGQAEHLELSIAGSGSCDAEGLMVESAAVHIAGSGDAIFACNGEVSAHLMGSGNVIVRGTARCSVHSVGSGTVTCERGRESVD